MSEFDLNDHEKEIAEFYEKQVAYSAFDKLVDLALDGVITLDQALTEYKQDYGTGTQTDQV